jgi:hypothetical protein
MEPDKRPLPHPPAANEVPSIDDGEPPDPEIQRRMVSNQVHAAQAWNDTAQDIVINNIVNENAERRESRRELIVLACLVLILLIVGSVYTYQVRTQDRFIANEREAGANTPYRPETIR